MSRLTRVALVVIATFLLAGQVLVNRLVPPASRLDRDLQKLIREFDVRPLGVRRFDPDPQFKLGQALFFDPVLSGPRNVSCATCHLFRYGTGDGLSRSIGVHPSGFVTGQRLVDGTRVPPRNALDLWNRGNGAVRALFWDGRVELVDPERRVFRSPLGDALPPGLDSLLAVQALFPLVTLDEMLGDPGDRSPTNLPGGHAGLLNDLATSRIGESHSRLMRRLLGGEPGSGWQEQYRALFRAAYPGKSAFTIVDVGNAIAHFEEMAFATRDSAWDRYLRGDTTALSGDAKRGAVLFYGKARCAACHVGPLFSDFSYHSVGVFGAGSSGDMPEDLGRWTVTRRERDRYQFRTPPLRNVTKTAPYFHDGSEPSLKGAVNRHLDPLHGSVAMNVRQISAISPLLLPKLRLSDREVDDLLAFLSALDFQPADRDRLVPERVPSGLPLAYQ